MFKLTPIEIIDEFILSDTLTKYMIVITYIRDDSIIHKNTTTVTLTDSKGIKSIYEYCLQNKLLEPHDIF